MEFAGLQMLEQPGTSLTRAPRFARHPTAGEYSMGVTGKGLIVDNNPHLADREIIFDIRVVEMENF